MVLDKWFAQKWVDIGSKKKGWIFLKMWKIKTERKMQNVSIQNASHLQKQDG